MAGDPLPYDRWYSGPSPIPPSPSPRTLMVNMPLPAWGIAVATVDRDGNVTIRAGQPSNAERGARIKELLAKYPEPWVIEKEPHDHSDGTKEFTHVRYVKTDRLGSPTTVSIGEHVTPDLAELLILLREAADELAARP